MLRLTGYGVRNLRALRDTGLVEIKPITVLVGKNSAGKSSFARILPLLKQSAERRKQAPLLWFGRLVDFGSFGEAVSSFAEVREIELQLRFSAASALYIGRRTAYRTDASAEADTEQIDVKMKLGAEGDEARTVLRELSLRIFGVEVRLVVDGPRETQLYVGGQLVVIPTEARLLLGQGSILPQPRFLFKEQPTSSTVSDSVFFQPQSRNKLGTTQVRTAISSFVHGNTLAERKDEIADRLPIASLPVLLAHCLELAGAPDTWRASIRSISSPDNWRLVQLQHSLILYKLDILLAELDQSIQVFCDGISYLEPLRATAQRFYRREEVSIDELDPKGLNTTFFIQGLTLRERESLNEWLTQMFGFTLSVKTVGGHSSLNIETGSGGQSRNMADVGLGYSQIAPVAIQLWAASRRLTNRPAMSRSRVSYSSLRPRDVRAMVVVEQPELHLHPAYQAKLADVFAASVKRQKDGDKSSPSIELLAETHSPNLINRLGELIGEGEISADDVQVLVFEPDDEVANATKIRVAKYDEKGILRNWPVGFFDY